MNHSKSRSANYINQLKGSVVYKLVALIASFLALPLMIKYLGEELFGIWATMLTLVTWVMLFDLGIGNGLKNKVSESIAQDKNEQALGYISAAYGLIGVISLILFTFFVIISFWLPWQSIFNTLFVSEVELRYSVIVLSFFIFFNFWLSLVNQIYHGLQKSSVVVFGQCLSNIFALLFIFIIYKLASPSIFMMVCIYGAALVLANIILSLLFFKNNRELIPKKMKFNLEKAKPLLSLGMKFFLIQIAVVIIFLTDKMMITQLIGPEFVTPYEVLFKLFSIITIIHGMILTPLWPAYSEAYNRGDLNWIKKNVQQQLKLAALLFSVAIILALVGPAIVHIWIGKEVSASQSLYFIFAIFIVLSVWSNVFAYVVNALNILNVQLFTAVFAALINIPLSVYFVRTLNLGLEGIVMATVVSLSIFGLLGPIQVYSVLKAKTE